MSKLFVFGIGGTGSRVIRSLSMLLASGVKLENIQKVVPIIIDPDMSNGDLTRTVDILSKYQKIRKKVSNPQCSFFNSEMITLAELNDDNRLPSTNNFKFDIGNTTNNKFRDFIGHSYMTPIDKDFCSYLFSDHNLESEMSVGFKGNPNIGSIVLNQLTDSKEYADFKNNFQEGDSVFIISSIFGGTGAAGFPLLVKNIRNDKGDGNSNLLQNAKIGAISCLPYFSVHKDSISEIESTSFMGKAKAALSYYDHSLFTNNSLNAFYSIGNTQSEPYENFDGRESQKNKAHFVELAGAISIVDFCSHLNQAHTQNGKAVAPRYFEFGIEQDKTPYTFGSFGKATRAIVREPLSRFQAVCNFWALGLKESLNSITSWTKDKENGVDRATLSNYFMAEDFSPFLQAFVDWLQELGQNNPSFIPFKQNLTSSNGLDFIVGESANSSWLKKASLEKFDKKMNEAVKSDSTFRNLGQEARLISLLDHASKNVFNTFYSN